MKKMNWTICLLVVLVLVSALSAAAQTGNPYFNVMDPSFAGGAKCDGVTTDRDTAAFNAALKAANNNGGGLVFVPSTVTGACVITTQLNMDHFAGVSLSGPPAANPGLGPNPHPTILFTGSAWPLISMRSTKGVSIKNLTLQYNNANFTGAFIDLSHASDCPPPGCDDSDMDYIADNTIQGTPSVNAKGANPLIDLDKAINATIDRNVFEWAANAIGGRIDSQSYSNVIRIRDNLFSGYGTNSISGNMIINPGTAWVIEGNTFEMGDPYSTSPNAPIPINANSVPCSGGCQITGNWFGDVNASFTGALISGTFQGTSITGNLISGQASNGVTGVLLKSDSYGVTITGNYLTGLATAFDFNGGGQSNINILGNSVSGVTQLISTGNFSGMIDDPYTGLTVHGNLTVTGSVSKSGGSFKIDHPLDPVNKYLSHAFVESPDMMNIYNGVVRLDARGRAEVKLPSYFQALNRDFRYQLTSIGTFAPVYVAQKIKGNSFRIAGGKPGMEVSWQVTGIRHDAYANAHRIIVEEDKDAKDIKRSDPK